MKAKNLLMTLLLAVVMLFAVSLTGAQANPMWGSPEFNNITISTGHLDTGVTVDGITESYWHGYVTGIAVGEYVVFSPNGIVPVDFKTNPTIGWAAVMENGTGKAFLYNADEPSLSNIRFKCFFYNEKPNEVVDASQIDFAAGTRPFGEVYSYINHNNGFDFAQFSDQKIVEFGTSYTNGGTLNLEYIYPQNGVDFSGFQCSYGAVHVSGAGAGTPTPEPATMILLGSGIASLLALRRRQV